MSTIHPLVGSNSTQSNDAQLAGWLATVDPRIDIVTLRDAKAPLLGVDLESRKETP